MALMSMILALFIGFACGYGVRELKSRRRRATIQLKYHPYHEHPNERL